MIYHKICPLCQTVCDVIDYFDDSPNGTCIHDDFRYSFIECKNSTIIDLIYRDIYVMLELTKSSKKTFIKTDSGQMILEDVIPFSWNNFEIDSFVAKVNKIVEMQTFI